MLIKFYELFNGRVWLTVYENCKLIKGQDARWICVWSVPSVSREKLQVTRCYAMTWSEEVFTVPGMSHDGIWKNSYQRCKCVHMWFCNKWDMSWCPRQVRGNKDVCRVRPESCRGEGRHSRVKLVAVERQQTWPCEARHYCNDVGTPQGGGRRV